MFEFFSGLFGILFFILFIVPFVLWIWALVDILKSEFTGYNKIIWLLLVIFLPLLGLT